MSRYLQGLSLLMCTSLILWACEPTTPSTQESTQEALSTTEKTTSPDASAQEKNPFNEQVNEPSSPRPESLPLEKTTPEQKPPETTAEKVPEAQPESTPKEWKDPTIHQGKATYYDADGTGNCSFPAVSPPMVAAMNEQEYGNADYCGACVKVDGPKGSIIVRVTDRCPECPKGHLDLSREAFAKIGEPQQGVIPITWQVMTCPSSGPIRYHYKDGSSQWWTAIQIRNHRLPLKQVQIMKNGQWQTLSRQRYNYFLDDKGAGPNPLRIRLTATNGQTLEDSLPAPASDLEVVGKQQF